MIDQGELADTEDEKTISELRAKLRRAECKLKLAKLNFKMIEMISTMVVPFDEQSHKDIVSIQNIAEDGANGTN